jgi:hypothetical protein
MSSGKALAVSVLRLGPAFPIASGALRNRRSVRREDEGKRVEMADGMGYLFRDRVTIALG